jgi:hypothetical protein
MNKLSSLLFIEGHQYQIERERVMKILLFFFSFLKSNEMK